jgi:periplasmic copper chaperone A
MLNKQFFKIIFLVSFLAACNAKTGEETGLAADTSADVEITDSWVRENAPGQSVGAAYMTLNSPQDSTLVYVETPAAGSVEIHLMLFDLTKPLKAGEKIDFKLCFKDKAGEITHQNVVLTVKSAN